MPEIRIASFVGRPGLLAMSDIKRWWLHQANINMNELNTRRLLGRNPNPGEASVVLDQYANTASAGSLIAFKLHHEDLGAGDLGGHLLFWRRLRYRQSSAQKAVTPLRLVARDR